MIFPNITILFFFIVGICDMLNNDKIVIVGGGLCGLTLSYLLGQKGINSTILEASNRLGGRIHTVQGKLGTPMELGATWFSDIHQDLLALLKELEIEKFPQYSKGVSLFQTKSFEPTQEFFLPEAQAPSYRIKGGTQQLIEVLTAKISTENVKLNASVTKIQEEGGDLSIETSTGDVLKADNVFVCIPPQVAANAINFLPSLPENTSQLLATVQTWMAGALKFTVEYAESFWRNAGYSGMLYSHAGIIMEMYDHTNAEGTKFALTGFLNGSAATYSEDVRKELVIKQLKDLFGDKAIHAIGYNDKTWTNEYVYTPNIIVQRPHQNNGHPLLQLPYMGGKLFFCCSETSTTFPGYMDGAVNAATDMVNAFTGHLDKFYK